MMIVCWLLWRVLKTEDVGWKEWIDEWMTVSSWSCETHLDFACSGSAEGTQARHIQFRCDQYWRCSDADIAARVAPRLCHTACIGIDQLLIGRLLKLYPVWLCRPNTLVQPRLKIPICRVPAGWIIHRNQHIDYHISFAKQHASWFRGNVHQWFANWTGSANAVSGTFK